MNLRKWSGIHPPSVVTGGMKNHGIKTDAISAPVKIQSTRVASFMAMGDYRVGIMATINKRPSSWGNTTRISLKGLSAI